MKPALYFESTDELFKHVNYLLVASALDRCPDELYASGQGAFHLNQKRKLRENGVTQEHWDGCKHLVPKAKRWASGATPVSTFMTSEEYGQWEMLVHISKVILS